MATHITGEQIKALREYADHYGAAGWKDRLAADWALVRGGPLLPPIDEDPAADDIDPYCPVLRALRDSHGPRWLATFDLDACEAEREHMLDAERHALMIDIWGSTSYPYFTEWNGYGYAIPGYCPEYHEAGDIYDRNFVTVLHFGFGHPKVPAGWAVETTYNVGECECPWCGESPKPEDCELCEGDGYVGDSCAAIVIFVEIDRDTILQACASTLWAMAWADHVEETDCYNLSGCQIENHMPEIGDTAHDEAKRIVTAIEAANGGADICVLFAACVDATNDANLQRADRLQAGDRELAARFGDCLAFEYTGAGVAWTDDHEDAEGFTIPAGESSCDVADEAAEVCCPPRED